VAKCRFCNRQGGARAPSRCAQPPRVHFKRTQHLFRDRALEKERHRPLDQPLQLPTPLHCGWCCHGLVLLL
jgi:hypothetical protein